MSRNKWVDRCLAATAQFVIIVAGVLAALIAQDWQDNLSARTTEIAHLSGLQRGIQQARSNLIVQDSLSRERAILLGRFLAHPDTLSNLSIHQADSLIYEGLFRQAGPSTALPSYDDLKSSGELGTLGSLELRRVLQVIEGAMNTLEIDLRLRSDAQARDLDPILASRTNFAQLMNAFGGDSIPLDGPPADHSDLLLADDVQSFIAFKIGLTRVVRHGNGRLRDAYDEALVLIDQRLTELGVTPQGTRP